MKNYVKPSALLSKFDVEDILVASGFNSVNTLKTGAATTQVYQEYLQENQGNNTAFVEFQW